MAEESRPPAGGPAVAVPAAGGDVRRPFRILKFGGTSVSAPEGIEVIRRRVEDRIADSRPVVVVSALAGTTDALLGAARAAAAGDPERPVKEIARRLRSAARRLLEGDDAALIRRLEPETEALARLLDGVRMLGECSPRTLDAVLSFGERTAAALVAAALEQRGTSAHFCDARAFVVTDHRFGEATVDFGATASRARAHFAAAPDVPVVTGFIGATREGHTTTLGRGASDYTAAILGAVLEAEAVEIWTDVPGVLSADPREVPAAFPLPRLSYDELLELSHWGARVVHPAAVRPLRERAVPIHIRSTLAPDDPGTLVSAEGGSSAVRPVRGIASVDRATLVQVEGRALSRPSVLARLVSMTAAAPGSPFFVSQGSGERSVCFALRAEEAPPVLEEIEQEFRLERQTGELEPLRVEEDSAIVAVVGEALRRQPGIAGRVFGILGNHGINIRAIAQGSSELSISFALAADQRTAALRTVHDAFFAPRPRPAELFVAGVGRVGSALMDQLAGGAAERHRLMVAGIARRSRAVTDPSGTGLGRWRDALDAGRDSLDDLVAAALASGRHPRVFVDCTASAAPVAHYERLLRAGVAVVTANKTGFSGALRSYRALAAAAADGARFYHETTVGAALPVLGTLRDLVETGDRVHSVDGVLSGSLGYVFDQVMTGAAFSEAVREARERGYTEPDPRDDLGGLDVARKLLILARQAGIGLEPSDVEVEPVLPPAVWASLDSDEFWRRLPELDKAFEERRRRALADGGRLVYLARLEGGRAAVRLETVGPDHPCWSLRGTENLVAICSSRYQDVPLAVRGPGAGPEITAAGVLADVLRARSEASDTPILVRSPVREVGAGAAEEGERESPTEDSRERETAPKAGAVR